MATALRRIHPASTAKLVARDLGISQRTVENWLSLASAPSLEHFGRMSDVYGFGLVVSVLPVLSVLAPLIEATSAETLRATTAELRRRQAQAAGQRGDA